MEHPGQRLRRWRKERGLSLSQFAARCEPPQKWTTVCHVENGRRSPGRRVANAIERGSDGEIRCTDWDDWEAEQEPPPPKTGTEGA